MDKSNYEWTKSTRSAHEWYAAADGIPMKWVTLEEMYEIFLTNPHYHKINQSIQEK